MAIDPRAGLKILAVVMSLIDTHCHLDIVQGRGIEPEESLRNAHENGVESLVQIAPDLSSSRANRELAERFNSANNGSGGNEAGPSLYWTAGLHPEAADDLGGLDSIFDIIRENRDAEYFLGVGETGLDYFHMLEHVENQKKSFGRHLDIAKELKLPVVLHTRDDSRYVPGKTGAITDALDMVRASEGVRGVLHCFTYGYEEAKPYVDLGWFVSYSGILTFKNAKVVQDGAARLPLECLMVETDAPFLAPTPFRGKTNQPAYVLHTFEYLAQLRHERNGEDPELVKRTVYENSLRFLKWKHEL